MELQSKLKTLYSWSNILLLLSFVCLHKLSWTTLPFLKHSYYWSMFFSCNGHFKKWHAFARNQTTYHLKYVLFTQNNLFLSNVSRFFLKKKQSVLIQKFVKRKNSSESVNFLSWTIISRFYFQSDAPSKVPEKDINNVAATLTVCQLYL